MKKLLALFCWLSLCGVALGQQSYVLYKPAPTGNPYYDTNIANVLISNVTFHGKVTFISNSNSPSLWNTNGAGLYSTADSTAQSLQFGSNTVASGIYSVALGVANTVSVGYGTIAGGQSHLVRLDGIHGTIGGGQANDVRTLGSFIGGGLNNVTDSGDYQVTAGGNANVVRGDYSFLGGGDNNLMGSAADGSDGVASVIGGGRRNIIGLAAGAGSSYSAILGGRSNIVAAASDYSTISGGSSNRIGDGNAVSGNFIGGGFNSTIGGSVDFSVIGGGVKNVAAADWTAILGGVSNNVTATYAMAIGNWLTNSTTKSVEIGPDNASKTRFDVNGVTALKLITATNGFASYSSNLTAVTSVALSGTPALWTNTLTKNVQAVWSGGTVSGVAVNNSLWPTPAASGYAILQPGEWLAFTNTGVPEFAWKPF